MKKLALIIAAAAAIGTVSPALADSVRVRIGDGGWHHRHHHERVIIREHRGWHHHYGWRNHYHHGASVVIR